MQKSGIRPYYLKYIAGEDLKIGDNITPHMDGKMYRSNRFTSRRIMNSSVKKGGIITVAIGQG